MAEWKGGDGPVENRQPLAENGSAKTGAVNLPGVGRVWGDSGMGFWWNAGCGGFRRSSLRRYNRRRRTVKG
ncbi:MAG: hypothetical protein KME26_25650 [Oscillatoria princeps RMCB-10]|nr:hypothetical protein [Oscillatoria princeps RMCB-10]